VRFAPHTDDDVAAMLDVIGVASVDDLFDQIPPELRLGRGLDIPAGVSEQEIVEDLYGLAARNQASDELVCFAGGGAYDHYIPSVVWALAGRSEFSTSYTPYQPELSQGVLQALFEFQSMVCEITAMEVSNASLYDGATALVEAVSMSRSPTRSRVLVAGTLDRRFVDTLQTYGRGAGYDPEVYAAEGGLAGAPPVTDDVAAVVVQHPNSWGLLEDVSAQAEAAHAAGARLIQVFDPLSLGVLAPPGELGADIAVAEGQALGVPLQFGGPYLGILAAKMADVRKMPGRIVGATVDADGEPGYVLTLQAREQHIRREKATSNICTNQTLLALAATIYLSWLGPLGLAEVGERCAANAAYARRSLLGVPGVEDPAAGAQAFKEFPIRLPRRAVDVRDALLEHGYLAGVPDPGDDHVLVIAVTERRSVEQIDGFVRALAEVLG
jgi:glycine dehydrogenase subunit 1